MQIVNLTQGSAAWHQHRAQHWNASDAPAMMGCSSYKTRSELVRELATGIAPEADAATERRFADGHRFEALARPLAEEIIGEELSPCVGTEGKLSASFDGLTFMNDTAFEHKSLNDRLRAAMGEGCTGADLPLQYQVQMEQQAAVAGCERILFMATKWAPDGTLLEQLHCWYTPNPELRAQILAGWEQLALEVAAYVPADTSAAPVVAEPVESLPAVAVQLQGSLAVVSNLDKVAVAVRAFIDGMVVKPATDQEFADAEAECKALKKGEEAMKAAVANALAQVSDVEAFTRTANDLADLMRTTRLAREKLVAAEKESRKAEIVASAQANLDQHIAALNQQRLGANWIPRVAGGFAEAIRGKKSLDNMRDAIAVVLTNAKADANALAGRLEANRQHLRQDDSDWIALFADFAAVGGKAPEDFQALAALRIGQHRQAEAKRLEAERERIRQEEEARAQRAAAAEAARAAAEQTRQLEAERARIRQEEQQRADAEAREKLAQANAQAQAGIAEGREAGALSAPLLDDLSATANHVHDSGVAALDTQQAISTAQASSAAAAPAAEDAGATITLGQLNALLKAENLSVKVSAETLDDQGLPYRKERGAVLVLVSDAKRMALKLALGFEKFAHALTAPA
ncbi:YqaJ viral recombinase family protein [Delftia tsuruhatensis]|uniref:YqaJ viral recombinase family protein n=1 Tax=Delftia tsuruhatensis TaxID=180282 RepID=UPI0023DC3022|nr:YqaJ viral recombinase family protein [Delftia tsuruhatensis]MDH0851834.1 YqaJ viral recombinase family protein [Delftia tsuruhatensis]WEM01104.1 YqaJ viral recombinase family protein [Delftia tsuruhatensis]